MAVTIDYKIEGMDCAEESAAIRDVLANRPGILELEFDLIKARMSVVYDPARVSTEEIVSAVAGLGMKAVPWTDRTEQKHFSFWRRHGRLVMVVISGAALVAGFLAHWLTHGSLVDALAGGEGGQHVFPPTSVLFYVGSVVAGAWFVVPKAVLAARKMRPDMNLLMVVAVAGAMVIGQWFEAATVTLLFSVALLLEHWSVGRARRAIAALLDLSPALARCVDPDSEEPLERPVEQVPVGTTILVKPGEKIPLDGVVVKGVSSVNQAPITGESMPVSKRPGEPVYAGTINIDGAIQFQTTRPAEDTTLARIIRLLERAQARRAPAQQWVDSFARYYTPAMMALAAVVAIVPPLLFSAYWASWLYRGLVILVIACPCALVISTPVSIVSALTSAARNGVLIKGGMYLEAAGRLRAIALDKTGTLTYGRPQVQQIVPLGSHSRRELLEIAAAMEALSEHPLARAILQQARAEGVVIRAADDFRAIEGMGAEARINGRSFWIGSHRLMHEQGQQSPDVHEKAGALEADGQTVVAVGDEHHVCGLIGIADGVRSGAAEAVRAVKQLGVRKVVMLTGDNVGTAQTVAALTGIDEFMAELLPEDKVQAVESLVRQFAHVAMVGDGINDAPAMVGVAMGAVGTDAAIETADIALMSDELVRLPWLIRHSRRALGIVKENISFALGLKLLFIVLALAGLASLWMAIAADTGASLLVIFNGLRLLRG